MTVWPPRFATTGRGVGIKSTPCQIVRELAQLGWNDERIGKELGMDSDEVLRLKQINGLLELFADRRYSEAWTVK
jgi:hypothetical protein